MKTPNFQRRHYEAIAKTLNECPYVPAGERGHPIAHDLAELFIKDNPNFNRERFLAASGVKDNE